MVVSSVSRSELEIQGQYSYQYFGQHPAHVVSVMWNIQSRLALDQDHFTGSTPTESYHISCKYLKTQDSAWPGHNICWCCCWLGSKQQHQGAGATVFCACAVGSCTTHWSRTLDMCVGVDLLILICDGWGLWFHPLFIINCSMSTYYSVDQQNH